MSEVKQWTVSWYENVGYSVTGREAFPNHSRIVLMDAYLAEKSRADELEIHKEQNLARILKIMELEAENTRFRVALNRIVGMVEIWTDEHGQKRTEEIYASKIAREALEGVN